MKNFLTIFLAVVLGGGTVAAGVIAWQRHEIKTVERWNVTADEIGDKLQRMMAEGESSSGAAREKYVADCNALLAQARAALASKPAGASELSASHLKAPIQRIDDVVAKAKQYQAAGK